MAGKRYVVDTGVFVRWYIPQVGWEHAREVRGSLAAGTVELLTPDLARYELANVLRAQGLLKGSLDRDQYLKAAQTIDVLGLAVPAGADALRRATELAADHMLRVFDALFVELALRSGGVLLTSDRRLSNAVADLVPVEVLRGI